MNSKKAKQPPSILVPLLLVLLSVALFILGLIGIVSGFLEYPKYENAASVSATVTRCVEEMEMDEDGVPESKYDIYVNYTYADVEYKDIYIDERSRPLAIGSEITIRVSSSDPSDPYGYSPLVLIVGGLILSVFGLSAAILLLKTTIDSLKATKDRNNT